MADIILALLVLAPVVVTYLLRSNAALSFMVLCADFVLISFGSADIQDLTKNLRFQINSSTINLILLALPFVITLLVTKKAVAGDFKVILHCVCALCASGLLALVAIPLLSESVKVDFFNNGLWGDLQKIQTPLVGTGAGLSLLLIWFGKLGQKGKRHK